tara:strand:+ start:2029 stop:2364 length:336 start_codon:yes stop_codon:yes gene_type:complete
MRFAEPHHSRRGAFLFVALFSCLQITLGFFLINGNGHDSVLSDAMIHAPYYAEAEIMDENTFDPNAIEPAAGDYDVTENQATQHPEDDPDIITQKLIKSLTTLSTLDSGAL